MGTKKGISGTKRINVDFSVKVALNVTITITFLTNFRIASGTVFGTEKNGVQDDLGTNIFNFPEPPTDV